MIQEKQREAGTGAWPQPIYKRRSSMGTGPMARGQPSELMVNIFLLLFPISNTLVEEADLGGGYA